MPLGGIGAGCICLNGYGGLQDFSIRNRPATSALPDGHSNPGDAGFALLHIKGPEPITRLLEGPFPVEKIYDQGLQAQGYRHGGYEGLPRFIRSHFQSGYPFGQIQLSDPTIPVEVQVTGWSPFVPLDEVASSLPCAILEYTLLNTSREPVTCEFSYHLSHLAEGATTRSEGTRNEVIPGKGVFFSNTELSSEESFGSASVTTIGQRPKIKGTWIRGGWFDAVSALWREVETGRFTANDGQEGVGNSGRNGGSVLVKVTLAPGEQVVIPVVITWHFPNSNQSYGGETSECQGGDCCCASPKWKTFYSSLWKDARDVANYVHSHYESLRERTAAFQTALLGSSLPVEALDAISANLAILKSPTVLRQANGNLWGWEGCFTSSGCCSGSCTHVWNYAQSLPHLFPGIERTLREQELERSISEAGHVNFRSALPDGPAGHDFHAAADGQLGGLMKLYRDWQITGDTEWLKKLYPLAKRSLEFCINAWDPDRKGSLSEPHHNTYDIEFWGPDGMCTTVYIGALSAMSAMAEALGATKDQQEYLQLATRGARLIEKDLFNGEYFEQKVQYRGLRNTSFLDTINSNPTNQSPALIRLLKKEGPKYQYGTGCLSDGVIGAWMASIYGIELPIDPELIRKNLISIHRYNFRHSLATHSNCQRPGYAMGNEPGLLLCSWPRGGKPTLPFVYSDEVWTGIEYQVASHLISVGLVKEGIEIVKAVRSRHDGSVRNPWNEYECGSYYARAMASFSLLGALSGFRYSAVDQTLHFGPKLKKRPFVTFFSTAKGYGTISLDKTSLDISVIEGRLAIERVVLDLGKGSVELIVNIVANPEKMAKISIPKSRPASDIS